MMASPSLLVFAAWLAGGAGGFCANAAEPHVSKAAETNKRALIPEVIVLLPLN
jgi:hypothetical protein